MKFPEPPREGGAAHDEAVRRLDKARDHQHERQEALEEAKGTPEEPDAATDLTAARDRTAAREAWLVWVERGL